MMEYNYTAIILKKKKIGETDRLYTFYTLESGKIQSIGRGIRKPKAKLAGHLETLSQSDIIVARRHGLGNIASALTEHYFLSLKLHEEILKYVFESISFFERLVDFEEKDEQLFVLLQAYLVTMNDLSAKGKVEKARVVNQGFLFQMLTHMGYHLEMQSCVLSGNPLSSSTSYVFSPDAGGIIESRFIHQVRKVVAANENAIKLMRLFSGHSLVAVSRVAVGHKDLVCVEHISRSFLQWIEQ